MYPIRRRASARSWKMSNPATRASPYVGSAIVASTRIRLVFPAPFGPISPKTSPRPTDTDRSDTAVVSP